MMGLEGVDMHYENTAVSAKSPVLEVNRCALVNIYLICRKISLKKPITVPGYLFLKEKLGVLEAKVCIPSPTLLHFGGCGCLAVDLEERLPRRRQV